MKKIYLLLVAIIVIVLVGMVIIMKKPKTAQEYLETGLTQFKKTIVFPKEYHKMSSEEYDEHRKMVISSIDSAIKSYQEIINKYPESRWADDAQFCIATAYFRRGDWDKAIEAFQKVITDYPEAKLEPQTIEEEMLGIPKASSNLHALVQERIAGIYYNMKKNYLQALIEYNKVIDKYPQDIFAHPAATYRIKRLCSELNDYEPAIKAYQKLLKTRTNTPKDVAFFEKRIKELQAKQAALKGATPR